jgi:signal peptidase I
VSLEPNQSNFDKVSDAPSGGEQASVSLAGQAAQVSRKSIVREYAEAIVVAMLLAFAIRVFVVPKSRPAPRFPRC